MKQKYIIHFQKAMNIALVYFDTFKKKFLDYKIFLLLIKKTSLDIFSYNQTKNNNKNFTQPRILLRN